MSETFPRLLVATEFAPNTGGGGPAVVRQMLKDWPRENLFWWSCVPDRDRRFGQEVASHRVATIPARLYPHRRLRGLKSWLLENVWTHWSARHFLETLRRFNPAVVWVIPHNWSIPPVAAALPATGIPFHVSIHDYMDTRAGILSFGRERSGRLVGLTESLYTGATTRDAISESMLNDLQARTGRSGTVSRAGLEPRDFERLAGPGNPPTDKLKIAYAGSILVEETFALFVRGLKAVRPQLLRPVSLEFFGGDSLRSREWFDPAWMNDHGNLPLAELGDELRKCTWGFSPMSIADNDPRYNQFSLPTKFVSYLAAGLPVITMGHPESSIVKMAEAYRVGPCIKSADSEHLQKELLAAFSIPDPWMHFSAEIIRCGRAEFDASRMRRTLYECFFRCAGREPRKSPVGDAAA